MRRASLATVFITVFLDLLGFGLVVPYLPGVARELGASDFTATLVGTAYSLGQLFFVPVWGALSDRVGRRPVLVVSVAATVVAMLMLGMATSLWMIFAARVLGGVATANIAVAQAYIADVTEPKERPKGMAIVGIAIGLGFVLGPAIGGVLAAWDPSSRPGSLPAFVAAGLSLLNLGFALFALPESLPPEKRRARGEPRASRLAMLRGLSARATLSRALLLNLVVIGSFAGFELTFRMYNEDQFGMSTAQTGQTLLLAGLVMILVQGGLLPRLAKLYEERTLVVAGLTVEAVGFAIVASSPPSITWLSLGTATLSLGSALVNPSLAALVSRASSASSQGSSLGLLQSSGALARVLGPPAAGVLYAAVSPRAPYVVAALGMLLGCTIALGLSARGEPKAAAVSPEQG